MRIFYAAADSPNALHLPSSQLWRANLLQALEDLGHQVIPFDYDLTPHLAHVDPANPVDAEFIDERRPHLESELLRQVEAAHRKEPIDVFFSYFYSACCRPEVVREIRRLGILTLNWYCNASYQFHLIAGLAPAYDYCLVPERDRLESYRRAGANPIHFREAANPAVYHPCDVVERYDAAFVGSCYGDRPALLSALRAGRIEAQAWGPGWLPADGVARGRPWWWPGPKTLRRRLRRLLGREMVAFHDGSQIRRRALHPPLADAEVVRMFSAARITLGFSSCGETHGGEQRVRQVRLRDVEAPMSGACYLVEGFEELYEYFEPGREILCYRDPDEMVATTRQYLGAPAARRQVREAARRRALADHTWHKRFRDLFAALGLPAGAAAAGREV